MFKWLITICFIFTSGCSIGMTNQMSPLKLKGHPVWPVIVDSGLVIGLSTATAIMADQHFESRNDRALYVTSATFLTFAFIISLLAGLDNIKCQKRLDGAK